jgi:hypothetical protein
MVTSYESDRSRPVSSSEADAMYVVLLRHPLDRLIAAYLSRDDMFPTGHPYRSIANNTALKNELYQTSSSIMTYAQLIGIPSCQTKMILGYECGTPRVLTDDDIIIAKSRLENNILFIGLMEESEASACLFYAMNGHHCPIDYFNLDSFIMPSRCRYGSDDHYDEELKQDFKMILNDNYWHDDADEVLYEYAQELFYERCMRFHITTKYYYKRKSAWMGTLQSS